MKKVQRAIVRLVLSDVTFLFNDPSTRFRHMRKNSSSPNLETLEQRWMPATVRDIAGALFISNPIGQLTVQAATVPGQVTGSDKGSTRTFGGVGRLISITGTNAADVIMYTGEPTFNGDVLINSGNGNDQITINGPIAGNVTLLSGLGSDVTTLSGTISGTLTYNHTAGTSMLGTNGATAIGASAVLTGLGTLALNGTFSVGGNLILSALHNSGARLN